MASIMITMIYQLIVISMLYLMGFSYCSANEGKLVLKPFELRDLIIEEQRRKKLPDVLSAYDRSTNIVELGSQSIEHFSTIESNDDEVLKSRKVWSRWSKWGDCSVTCGQGVITRRRFCVSGRCAAGELEEQRRLCYRPPCSDLQFQEHDTY